MSISNFYKRVIELLESISGGGGGGGATETTLQSVNNKLPALSGGKIPVEVGSVNVTVNNANLEISNDVGNPVPASLSSIPLPTGASTEATLSSVNAKIPTNLTVSSTRLLVDNSGVTQPISASSLPLPSGASTESTLSTLNGKIPSNLTVSSTRLLVDSSGVTQPISASSLPLPSGASTETTLTNLRNDLNTLRDHIITYVRDDFTLFPEVYNWTTAGTPASQTIPTLDGSNQPIKAICIAMQVGSASIRPIGSTGNYMYLNADSTNANGYRSEFSTVRGGIHIGLSITVDANSSMLVWVYRYSTSQYFPA